MELVEILTNDLHRVKSLLTNPKLATLLDANAQFEKRIDEARAKNAVSVQAKRRRQDLEKQLETEDFRKSRTALEAAIRKAARL